MTAKPHTNPGKALIDRFYPEVDRSACVNTPALQTNFSPATLAFREQIYLDMADVMAAGATP